MKFGRAGTVFAGHRGKFNKFDIENHKIKNPDLCIVKNYHANNKY